MLFESSGLSPRASHEQICLSPVHGENTSINPSTQTLVNMLKGDAPSPGMPVPYTGNPCGTASPMALPPQHRASSDGEQVIDIDELLADGLRRSSISTPSHSNGSTTSTTSGVSTSTNSSTYSSNGRNPGSRRISSDCTCVCCCWMQCNAFLQVRIVCSSKDMHGNKVM